ncbi:MAG: hypothetical protein ACI4AM_06160 [Muribaculaceae bacterium]
MKRLTYILIILTAALATACQNNGDIGDLYGSWRVDSYTIDGNLQEGRPTQTVFSFQSTVVNVSLITDEYGGYWQRFGTWSETDTEFIFDFTHHDNKNAPGTGMYEAPEWLNFTSDAPMVLHKDQRSSREMTLSFSDLQGRRHVYVLKKTW